MFKLSGSCFKTATAAKRYMMFMKPLVLTPLAALVHNVHRQRLELEILLMLCKCNKKLSYIYMLIVGVEFFCL